MAFSSLFRTSAYCNMGQHTLRLRLQSLILTSRLVYVYYKINYHKIIYHKEALAHEVYRQASRA